MELALLAILCAPSAPFMHAAFAVRSPALTLDTGYKIDFGNRMTAWVDPRLFPRLRAVRMESNFDNGTATFRAAMAIS
jgi:hypothetical protein